MIVSEADVERLAARLRSELEELRKRLPPIVMDGGVPSIEVERTAHVMRVAATTRMDTIVAGFVLEQLEALGLPSTPENRRAIQDAVARSKAWELLS